MQYTEREILERADGFCKEPKPFFLSNEREFLQDLVLDLHNTILNIFLFISYN